VKKRLLR